ncbi:single-stranded DNA-binding protein [Patescibacteria group bacterium]
MSSRSLNKAIIIGNLTRDPELRYTPQGAAVCTFGVATNRSWSTESGERKEEAEFHRVVAWNKLAEICSQFLVKGRRVYLEGRLQTRQWTGQDGAERRTTEIVVSEMIILDGRRTDAPVGEGSSGGVATVASKISGKGDHGSSKAETKEVAERNPEKASEEAKSGSKKTADEPREENKKEETLEKGEISKDDIPF